MLHHKKMKTNKIKETPEKERRALYFIVKVAERKIFLS